MEKSLFEQTGGTYTQVGDYLLPDLILPPEKERPIGVWGQRHAWYLKRRHKILYFNLLTSRKLNGYLLDIEEQVQDLFIRIVNQMTKCEGATEHLKPENQMEWFSE